MTKADVAERLFNQGFNCSQAVFSAFCGESGTDNNFALRIAHGFGAGMGRRQEVCGAVTGAYMVLGWKFGSADAKDNYAKERIYCLVREFAREFEERNRTVICADLLGVDLINGDKAGNAVKVKAVCPKAIRDAAEILEKIIGREREDERLQ